MFFGFLGVFFISFFEGKVFKFVNHTPNRNYISALFCITTLIGLIFISVLPLYVFQDNVNWAKELSFFYEKWFYLSLVLETCLSFLYREAYKVYDKNYTIVNMFMFSTIFIMPIYAYILKDYVDLNQSVVIAGNLQDIIITSLLLLLGTIIYFHNKIKLKQITNIWILIALAVCALNSFYFSTKLIQSYNGVLIYSFLSIVLCFNFLCAAYIKKEEFKVKSNKKYFGFLIILKILMQLIYIKSIAFIPVEIGPIVRRISQLSSGIIIDKKILNKTELFGIFIIIAVFVYNIIILK
jgi:hypothetical protein